MKSTFQIAFVLLFFSAVSLYGQKNSVPKFELSISQKISADQNFEYEYHLKRNRLKIFIVNPWGDNSNERKLLHMKILRRSMIDSIYSIVADDRFKILDETYSGGFEIDDPFKSISWTFEIESELRNQKIVLDNYYLQEVDAIIELINSNISEDRRYISLADFNIEK